MLKNYVKLIIALFFVSNVTGQNVPTYVPTNGLLGWWPFNGNANDESGNGNNGTVNGATLTTDRSGKANSAYNFANNQEITIANSATKNTYPLTISVWYNTADVGPANGNIFSKYTVASWNGFGLFYMDQSAVQAKTYKVTPFYLRSTSNRLIGEYNEPIWEHNKASYGTWYNLIVTYDNTGGNIYLNGAFISNHKWTGTAGASVNSNLWKIGGKWDQWFNGKIDDIGVWNRVLTDTEIKQLYTSSTNNCTTAQPVVTNNQSFCAQATIADLKASGTNIKWYTTATGGTALTTTTALNNGTIYYASQTLNNCESTTRAAVTVTINSIPALIGLKDTTICDYGSIKLNVKASVGSINWYNTITGGTKLSTGESYTTPNLYSTTTFYVEAINGQCTSQRTPIKVNVNNYSIDWSDTVVCIGNTTKLTAISNNIANTVNSTQIDALIKSGNWTLKSNYNNHYYLQYKERKNWEDAKKLCEANGGYIFCVNDKLENDNVAVKIANSETYGDFLIGLYQDVKDVNYSEPSGGWKWVDGSPLNYTNWASTKTNWVADEPSGGGENYALIDWSNMGEYWNDVEGHISGTVIMEYSGTTEYLWSTGETTQTINPTITKPTDFWVDITTNGVTCRKYISINVYPTLKGDLTMGNNNQTKCVNQPIENIEYTFNNLYYYPISLGAVSQMPALINTYVKGDKLYINGTPSTSGTYNYSISVKGKCEATDIKGVLVINSLPNASIYSNGPSEVCEGNSVNLIAKGGVYYKWSNGLTTDNINVKESGDYTVNVIDQNGCVSTAKKSVIINPNPIVSMNDLNPLTLKTNTPIKLYGKPTGGTFVGPGVNGAEFNPSYTTLGKKIITYNYTTPQGCSGSTSISTIVVDSVNSVCSTYDTLKIKVQLTTGIKAGQQTSMNVYPNPTSDILIIEANDIQALGGYKYKIVDLQGKEVYNALATTARTEISLKSIGAKGIYILHIVDEKGVSIENKKIVLE